MRRAGLKLLGAAALAATLVPGWAGAEVENLGPGGFTVALQRDIRAEPKDVYAALTERVSHWWESDHSWSGDAANLYVDATPGGCFCERLENGGWVEHLRVIYLAPGQELRLRGSLGPLMDLGLVGTMIWRLEPVEREATDVSPRRTDTRFTWRYVVQGHMAGGFEQLAPVVDRVNATQLDRLAALFGSG
ncbi:MAG: hypothetical protein P8008_06995 [Gammaproteobacteria bacterium]